MVGRSGLLRFHELNLRDKIIMGRITEASMSYIDFLDISSRLTGFDVVELEATGMAETYLKVIEHETPVDTLHLFFTEARNILRTGLGDEEKTNALIASRLFLSPTTVAWLRTWFSCGTAVSGNLRSMPPMPTLHRYATSARTPT